MSPLFSDMPSTTMKRRLSRNLQAAGVPLLDHQYKHSAAQYMLMLEARKLYTKLLADSGSLHGYVQRSCMCKHIHTPESHI